MLSRAARLLVLASFLVSIGMHTAVLQAVAWAKMTVEFARHDTVAVSLAKTFDGNHPCPICLSLKKAGAPFALAAAPSHSRLVFAPPTAAPRAACVAVTWAVSASPRSALTRGCAPGSPPPKAALS